MMANKEKMPRLVAEVHIPFAESAKLERAIKANLKGLGYLTGSTMPKLAQGNLHRVRVIAPPLAEEKAIAAVLGSLDDKIVSTERTITKLGVEESSPKIIPEFATVVVARGLGGVSQGRRSRQTRHAFPGCRFQMWKDRHEPPRGSGLKKRSDNQ